MAIFRLSATRLSAGFFKDLAFVQISTAGISDICVNSELNFLSSCFRSEVFNIFN